MRTLCVKPLISIEPSPDVFLDEDVQMILKNGYNAQACRSQKLNEQKNNDFKWASAY